MAKESSSKELKKLQEIEDKHLRDKQKEFASKGKTFRQDPYGPGIVPDDIYDSLRDPKDPKYKKNI